MFKFITNLFTKNKAKTKKEKLLKRWKMNGVLEHPKPKKKKSKKRPYRKYRGKSRLYPQLNLMKVLDHVTTKDHKLLKAAINLNQRTNKKFTYTTVLDGSFLIMREK